MRRSRTGPRLYWNGYLEIPIGVVLDMKEYSLRSFLGMGAAFRYLQGVKEGWPVHRKDALLDNLQGFLEFLVGISVFNSAFANNRSQARHNLMFLPCAWPSQPRTSTARALGGLG